MADRTATFAIELDDEGASKSAEGVADALEKLKKTMQSGTQNLRAMQSALKNLQGGSVVNIAAARKLQEGIKAQQETIAKAQEKYLSLGGNLRNIGSKSREAGGGVKAFAQSVSGAGGPLGTIGGRLSAVAELMGGGVVAGAIAGAAAVAVLVAAMVAATAALLGYGIATSGAARDERLMLEGMMQVPTWMGLAKGSADALQESINGVAAGSALGRDKIAGFAQDLYRAGLRGQSLTDAIEATSIASSAAGSSYGELVKGVLAGSAGSAAAVANLAAQVKDRFGGVASAQALSLGVQFAKLRENITRIFSGLKLDGLLAGVKLVTDLFSQNTASGQALKVIFETLFQPIIGGATSAAPVVKRFIQGIIIGMQEVVIGVLQVRLWFKNTFGDVSLFSGLDKGMVALEVARLAVYGFAGVLGILALALAAIAVGFLINLAAIGLVVAAVYYVGKGIFWLLGQFADLMVALDNLDWIQLGANMIAGLVKGLKAGVGLVVDAVKWVGDSAVKAMMGALDSHSPSRRFYKAGITAPQGFSGAVEDGTPDVERAVQRMVSLPGDAVASPSVASGSSSPAGAQVEIHEVHYHASDKASHQGDADDFVSKLINALEGAGIHAGAPT